jgi:hypothetical protein
MMMSDEPATPQDGDGEENEVLREARLAKEARARADAKKGERKLGWKTAAAAGLGSAAIMAALLYANRDKRD